MREGAAPFGSVILSATGDDSVRDITDDNGDFCLELAWNLIFGLGLPVRGGYGDEDKEVTKFSTAFTRWVKAQTIATLVVEV